MPQLPRLPSQLTYNDLNGEEARQFLNDWFDQLLRSHPLLQKHLTLPMAKFTLNIDIAIDMYVGGSVPFDAPPERVDITGRVVMDNAVAGSLPSVSASASASNLRSQGYEHTERRLSTTINAAPVPGGRPPDEIRAAHDLPVPGPGYGPRETGSHMFLADIPVADAADATGGRRGDVAEGYRFSEQVVRPNDSSHPLDQHIPVEKGEIHIDLSGDGIRHESGMTVRAPMHIASVKEQDDRRGKPYSSVNGVYDAGPAGLMTRRGGGGLGSDGRSRISFGNSHRG